MRRIRLHGALAELVGPELELDVGSPAEAVRAIARQHPPAMRIFLSSEWLVLEGGRELDALGLLTQRPVGPEIEIVPAPVVAGDDAGIIKFLSGLLLIGAALLVPGLAGITLVGDLTLKGFVGSLGAVVGLSGLSKLLAPSPRPDPMAPEDAQDRQTRLFGGSTNLLGQGHPIPILYGQFRAGSVRINTRIESKRNPESVELKTLSEYNVADIISEGPIEGLALPGLQSVYLDGTRVQDEQGGLNFQGVGVTLIDGAPASPAFQGGVERIFGVGQAVTNTDGTTGEGDLGAVTRAIDDTDVQDVRVTIRTPQFFEIVGNEFADAEVDWGIEVKPDGGAWQAVTSIIGAGEELPWRAVQRVDISGFGDLFCVEGPWAFRTTQATDCVGFDLKFGCEYSTAGGADQLCTIRWRYRIAGSADPWTIHQYVRTAEGNGVNKAILTYEDTITRVEGLAANQWEIELELDPDTEGSLFTCYMLGQELIPGGTLLGRAFSPYEEDHIVEDLAGNYGAGPWEIRVRRNDADSDPSSIKDEIWFDRYAEIIPDEFEHADAARVELKLDQDSTGGRIPVSLYESKGRLLELPSNLTTSTRVYSPTTWDGTFKVAEEWYDNPAWMLWDLLRNARYGFGRPESELDKWSFYDAGVWCDELVSDGAGGTHPRFTFHHQFTTREDALQQAQALLSAMQAQIWWGGGKLFLTQDKPADPVRIFTNATVRGGVFDYGGVSRQARTTAVLVSYRNAERGYEADFDADDRPHMIDRFGRNEDEVLAIGATNWAQARRRGRYELLTSELEAETIRFGIGAQDAFLEPGQIIETRDENRDAANSGGRVVAWSAGILSLDTRMAHWDDVVLTVMMDDGTYHETDISPSGGGGGGAPPPKTFTLDTALPVGRTILVGAPWIAVDPTERTLWRVLEMKQNGPDWFDVEAVRHDPTKQARIEDFADTGSALTFYSHAVPFQPTNLVLSTSYDAAADLWSVVADFDSSAGRYARMAAQVTSPLTRSERTTSHNGTAAENESIRLVCPIGDHATFGGLNVAVEVRHLTADGATQSAAAADNINIPSSPP